MRGIRFNFHQSSRGEKSIVQRQRAGRDLSENVELLFGLTDVSENDLTRIWTVLEELVHMFVYSVAIFVD